MGFRLLVASLFVRAHSRGAARTQQWRRGGALRPLPAAPLVVRRRYLFVMPRPMPAAPRRYLIVVPRPFHAAALVVRRRYLVVLPRPIPAAPRNYLIVMPRPSPPLAVFIMLYTGLYFKWRISYVTSRIYMVLCRASNLCSTHLVKIKTLQITV